MRQNRSGSGFDTQSSSGAYRAKLLMKRFFCMLLAAVLPAAFVLAYGGSEE